MGLALEEAQEKDRIMCEERHEAFDRKLRTVEEKIVVLTGN